MSFLGHDSDDDAPSGRRGVAGFVRPPGNGGDAAAAVNPLAIAPPSVHQHPGSPTSKVDIDTDLAVAIAMSMQANAPPKPSKFVTLPEDLLLQIASYLWGAELFALRRINTRFAAFWARHAYDKFRPLLMPTPGTWCRRGEDSGTRSVSTIKNATSQQLEDLRGFSRVSRVVTAAAKWLQDGIRVPREVRFGKVTLAFNNEMSPAVARDADFPDGAPAPHTPPAAIAFDLDGQELQPLQSSSNARPDERDEEVPPLGRSFEEPAADQPQARAVMLRSGSQHSAIAPIAAPGVDTAPPSRTSSFPNSTAVAVMMSPPRPKRASDEDDPKIIAKRNARHLKLWMNEMRRYWLCRRNIFHGLCNFTALERHSHATPVLLPNGSVCFSRWQMLSCFVRFEEHCRPELKDEWGAHGERGRKKRLPKCEGDPATSTWARTGHIASHRDTITVIKYHAPSECVLTASLDGTIKMWKPRAVNEAPAHSHSTGPRRPNAKGPGTRELESSDSDTDDDVDVYQANETQYQSCGEPPVLSFATTEDDPENQRERSGDATWLTCISTFDVPAEALSIPRCGVFSVDILEMEGFFGERCLAPLLAVGMESGHIVIVWCTPAPDDWQVIDVHYTGDLRAQAIKFLNHVPFAPSFLMSREAKKVAAMKASATTAEAATVNNFLRYVAETTAASDSPVTPPVDGVLASVPFDPCHPYTIRQATPDQYAEHDRAVQHADMFEGLGSNRDNASSVAEAARGNENASTTITVTSLPAAQTSSDYFLETGVVHVAVVTLSAVMIIEFQINRSIEVLGFDEFSDCTPLQQRVLRHVRTDGMSNGCFIPRRRKSDRIRPAKYVLSPCDVSSVTRLFGMSVNDIVGFDIPAMCHSMQFPLFPAPRAQRSNAPAASANEAVSTPVVTTTTLEERRLARPTSFALHDEEAGANSANANNPDELAQEAGAAAAAPETAAAAAVAVTPPAAAVAADASVEFTVTRSNTGLEAGGTLPRIRSNLAARALPAFPPLDRDDESSVSTTRAHFPQSMCGTVGPLPQTSRPVFTFGDARVANAPWQGNPFFLAPTVALVTSEGRLVLITKRSSSAREMDTSSSIRASKTYRLDTLYPHSTAQFTCCKISPCSGIMATGYEDGVLRLYLRVACLPQASDARGSFAYARPPHVIFSNGDDPSHMFGPVYETDSMVRHIAGMVTSPAMTGTGLTDGMVSVRLFPTHRGSVCSVHLDGWKLTSVDALSTVFVIDLRTFQILWVVSQRPRPFAPSGVTWRDRTVALDSMSHSYVLRQVQWLNESLLVSPLGVTKHAFVAHFGGKFKRDPLPDAQHPSVANADATVGDADSHDWMNLVRHRMSAIAFQSRAAAQFHRSRLADAMRQAAQLTSTGGNASPDLTAAGSGPSAAAPSQQGAADRSGGATCDTAKDEEWDTADSARSGRYDVVCDTNPYNALACPFSPSATLRDHAKALRVFVAEPHGLSSHVLHIVGFPMTLLMIATFATLVCVRLDGLINVDWWVILIPHMIMWPDYTALNYFAYNRRALQHSGFAYLSRVFVDLLYVVVFPLLYVFRANGYFYPHLQSVSWVYLTLPLNACVIINVIAAFVERHRDTKFRLQATESTSASRALVGAIDVIQALLAVWLITLLACYFDGPPADPTLATASDNSTSGLSIFLAVLPLWIAIGVVIVIIPKMPAFNRAVVTAKTFAALASCYLGVMIFLITPLVLFCLKYNNYYAYTHDGVGVSVATNNTTAAPTTSAAATTTAAPSSGSSTVSSTSTISALGSLSLTLIMSPLLVLVIIAHVLAVSNVVGHYNRLMRGYSRRR